MDKNKELKQKTNAKQLPKMYYFKHIKAGLVGYDKETLLVTNEALKKMCKSFEGKPLVVLHADIDEDFIDNLQTKSDGYVTECFFNTLDGCWWGKFVAVSDLAHEKIANGWSVSNAYVPTELGGGGFEHNLPYNREVLNGEYTHLAIVPNPRYEDAVIMSPDDFKKYNDKKTIELEELKNSKKRGKVMLKFFQKKEVENAIDLENAIIQTEDGTEICLKNAVELVVAEQERVNAEEAKKEEEQKKKDAEKINEDAEIDVGDEKMTVKDLVSKYENIVKKNAEDDAEKKEKEEKENAEKDEEEEEKKKKDEEEKANAKKEEEANDEAFKAIANAKAIIGEGEAVVETSACQVKRGEERYGSGK